LAEESNLLVLAAPINIIGDVHGQFYDVLKLLAIGEVSNIQEDYRLIRGISFWGTTLIEATTHLKPFSILPLIKSCIQNLYTCLGAITNHGTSIWK